eukprot:g63883.t1
MESAPAWASFIKRVEKLLWQIVRSRPTASHSASSSSSSSMPGAAELAEAKRLFQTKTNDNDVLVVDKLRREPAFWHQRRFTSLVAVSSPVAVFPVVTRSSPPCIGYVPLKPLMQAGQT